MCVPLGHRNYGGPRSGSIKTKISKQEVEEILSGKTYDICQWKRYDSNRYGNCSLSEEELLSALHDEATSVVVANTSRTEYKRGYRTVVMEAPCIQADVVLRIEK